MSHHHHHQQQRVVADGWGRQASGSVFCAESSLRYIFESPAQPPAPGTTAAAITSLASGEFDHGLKAKSTNNSTTMYPPTTPSYDKLTSSSSAFMSANMAAAKLHPHGTGVVHTTNADGVDLFEAQIAKACAQITKQVASLPHSFRECSVCLTQNAYAQIHVCGHTFHSKCFLRWFRMNRSCPLCRGPVDAIQVAPVLSVQDELEAIMAEMDDEDDHTPLAEGVDPLMANPDLISFLGEGFDDADMEMMALEELTAGADKMAADPIHNDDDVSMDDDDDDCGHHHHPHHQHHHQHHHAPPVMTPTQYAPTSTMPNYWNVLNQGLTMPSVMPVQPPAHHHHHQTTQQSLQQQQQRVVPIAPKPDGQFHVPTHAHPTVFGQFPTPRATSPVATHVTAPVTSPTAPRVVSCRCTGGCRNGRCACVKEGGMCGAACRCTSCKNPFLMVKAAGADIDALLQDACFMHNVSKTRDMVQRMQEPVEVPCCGTTLTVLDCVQGYLCTQCDRTFDFSWCMNKLLDHDKTPRNHCEICKRCCDHRDVHCNDCGRCYFAGVAASLPCPCKESSRKRRDHSQQQPGTNNTDAVKEEASGGDGEEDKDGECTIM